MARRGISSRGQRDDISPSLEDLLAPPLENLPIEPLGELTPSEPFSLTEIEDRRLFNPESVLRSALDDGGRPAPARRIPRNDRTWSSVGFNHPQHVVICARRKERREVLFAKRRHRRGGGGSRRRNWWSNVRC